LARTPAGVTVEAWVYETATEFTTTYLLLSKVKELVVARDCTTQTGEVKYWRALKEWRREGVFPSLLSTHPSAK